MMSFPIAGATLTLDFPHRGRRTLRLLDELDRIAISAGGRVNPLPGCAHVAGHVRRLLPALAGFRSPYRSRLFLRVLAAGDRGRLSRAGAFSGVAAGCSTVSTVRVCWRPSRAVQAMDWPAASPIRAVPIGVRIEIRPCSISASPGKTSWTRRCWAVSELELDDRAHALRLIGRHLLGADDLGAVHFWTAVPRRPRECAPRAAAARPVRRSRSLSVTTILGLRGGFWVMMTRMSCGGACRRAALLRKT